MPVTVKLFFEGGVRLPLHGFTKRRVFSVVRSGCEALSVENASVTVVLMDNPSIRAMNREYRNKDYATDVISFAYRDSEMPGVKRYREHFGDIFISADKALEQAREQDISFTEEMTRLLVHALCHCAGYDHEISKKEERRMHIREDELLSYISNR